jgi:hypothetical protein
MNAKRVITAIQKVRLELGQDVRFISNKAASFDRTISHMAARGSNGLADPILGHTLLHIGPDEYEELCLVNKVFGLQNGIRLRHVDEFNQACGRNMGFRNDGTHEHHAIISRRLWEKIRGDLARFSRYTVTVYENAETRSRSRSTRKDDSSRTPALPVFKMAA